MHVDGTVARVNGTNNNVVVCSNGAATMYFARENKGHARIKDTPVEPDNNLCERKARIIKGKINQAISLRSFEQLTYFCECLSVLDHFATDNRDNLYQSVKEVFKRQNSDKPQSEKPKLSNKE